MKKKLLISVLALIMCITLVGCGKTESNNNKKENSNTNNGTSSSEKSEYNYFDGKLTQIVDEEGNPKQTDFVIDGIILVGNHHEYREDDDTKEAIDYLVEKGYNKENINKDFYLSEWIDMYIDTKYNKKESDVKILITPHKTVEELEKMSLSQLEDLANENGGYVLDYKTPDEDNHKYVGNGYVNQDSTEGKYDILFTYKGKLAYFININLTKEEAE